MFPARPISKRSVNYPPGEGINPPFRGGGLAALLGEILDRSHAVPLPDPESALGLCLTSYEFLGAYERESLRRSSASPEHANP